MGFWTKQAGLFAKDFVKIVGKETKAFAKEAGNEVVRFGNTGKRTIKPRRR